MLSLNDRESPENHRALIAAYLINPGDLVFDIGAHIGSFVLYYSKLVGEDGMVVGI